MKNFKFIISGGGTGGHIYPAIAIANELKNRFPAAEILFVGANDKMIMDCWFATKIDFSKPIISYKISF